MNELITSFSSKEGNLPGGTLFTNVSQEVRKKAEDRSRKVD
jgi:hypothetical protein